jgi:hypothetical protein
MVATTNTHAESSGRVRTIAVPTTARTLSALSRIDYADAFLVETGPLQDRTGEQWARAILEAGPTVMRRSLRWSWFAGCAVARKWRTAMVRAIWAGVAPHHLRVVPFLLEQAARPQP